MNRRELLGGAASAGVLPSGIAAQTPVPLPEPKPVPRMQALPLPHDQAALERDGVELARCHYGKELRRPFLYPIIGPSGRSLTRMGHPHATVSHSHHNSVWLAHNDVNGDVFWADNGPGTVAHQYVVEYSDGNDEASIVAVNHWVGANGRLHMVERRGMKAVNLPDGEWLLLLDAQFEANKGPAVLGKTPFGMVAVRMAKTIGVDDGGGLIRNSQGNVNEQGENGVFRKRARWVDYSGPIVPAVNEGITLLDHPANPNHPSYFHVRQDGWMGASLTFEAPLVIEPGKPLRLRYGLYVHRGVPEAAAIEKQWLPFSKTVIEELPNSRK